MAHNYRELLAYIGWGNKKVTIELIKLTKNGHSYYFQGELWLRNLRGLGGSRCTSASGEKLEIAILNRNRIPYWVNPVEVVVAKSAAERFEKWTNETL